MPTCPAQPRGQFACRMLDCDVKLPSCRILNHIRSLHADHLTEVSFLGQSKGL